MPDAIDNLVQDINQNNTSVDEFPGYPGYQLGQEVPGMAGVRIGDLFYGLDPYGQEAPYNWRTGGFEFQAAPQDLSNPSTLASGGEIDYNIPDDPTIRTNIGNTDEKDAFIGGVYTPGNQQQYITGGNVLVPPDKAGGFVGVEYLDPSQVADITAGQTPSSLPEEFITRGETVKIPGRGLPSFEAVGKNEDGIVYLDTVTRKVFFPGDPGYPSYPSYPGVSDLTGNPDLKSPSTLTKGTGTSVGAVEPSTTSEGGFDNTGGNVTVGPGNVTAGPGGAKDITPDWKPGDKPGDKPKVENDIDGDGISDVWRIATGGNWRFDTEGKWSNVNPDYIDPRNGEEYPPNNTGDRWNFRTKEWDYAPVKDTGTTPGKDTGTTTTPPGGGTTTTPPGGGTTTTPPGGGVRPGTGTGTGTYTGTPYVPTGITPLVRRETVIPTKGTKEVPLPDRQADPFAQIYADLLANAKQQKDQYRYINYDPDQIMNAAMSGFRRRGAMRSLQGY